jgi:hypothetical protein
VITWLPPNHRNSKRHRVSFVIQPPRKIFYTFTAAFVRGLGFVLVADLASEIHMIRLFHYRDYGLSLPCERHFAANVTEVICTIYTVTAYHECWITLLGSLCGIYGPGVYGCVVHDGLIQYDAVFWNLSLYSILVYIFTQRKLHYGHKRQARRSRKQKRTFIFKCLMDIFLKYIINVCGFLRNRSQFWVFIVIFVL